jgi:ligand-binding sensor domain-containing protein
MELRTWHFSLLLIILGGFFHQRAVAQHSFRNPTILKEEDGIPDKYITDITRDREGFMWFGTLRGLCRYDGSQIKSYKHIEGDSNSLTHNFVIDVTVDREGRLWVGTANGLNRYRPGSDDFETFNYNPEQEGGLPGIRVNRIFQDREGTHWLGIGGNGLAYWKEGTDQFGYFSFEVHPDDPSIDVTRLNAVVDVTQDQANDSLLWVATLAGLVSFNKYTKAYDWHYFQSEDKDRQYGFNSMKAVFSHSDGRLYVGSWGGAGIFDPASGTFKLIEVDPALEQRRLSDRMVRSILAPVAGEVWISYAAGMIIYDTRRDTIRQVFYNDEENGREYGATYIDEQGRIWARTGQGVFIFNPLTQQFETYDFPRSGNPDHVLGASAVVESRDGRQLIFSLESSEGIYLWDRQAHEWEVVPSPPDEDSRWQEFHGVDMKRLRDGRIFVLTPGRFFEFLEEERRLVPTPLDFREEAPGFRRFVQDDAGDLWVGSRRNGLYRIDLPSGKVRIYQKELDSDSTSNRYIWLEEIYKGDNGNIYIRTAWGHSVYDVRRDTFFNRSDDPQGRRLSFSDVRNFDTGPDGKVWMVGDDPPGLGWIDPEKPWHGLAENIPWPASMQSDNIEYLQWDGKDHLWINHEYGLTRYNPSTREFSHFDRGYGKPASSGRLMECLSTGEIVIDAPKGFTIFQPGRLKLNREIPRPYLTSVKVLNREMVRDTTSTPLHLHYQQNFLSFEFSSIGFNLPEHQRYAYMLKGLDEDWNYTSQRNFASYTHLDGGDYVFYLKAASSEGVWSDPLALAIHINTPWWKTWWFWTLLGAVIVAITILAVQWRIRQVRNQEQLRAEFERKLADVEMNALRAQMNPHFLFNCLNSIDYYIIKNQTEKASDYLNRFSRLIRLILQNSRNNYVNLRDELEALKLYIEMESLRFDKQFEYRVSVSHDLPIDDIEIPPMLFQPFVENAIWHGLMQKQGRGRLEISLTQRNGGLHCMVEDNGIGREAARQMHSKSAGKRRSMGMQITNDRIGLINKLFNQSAEVSITDLKDREGKALGTRVEINIPL